MTHVVAAAAANSPLCQATSMRISRRDRDSGGLDVVRLFECVLEGKD